MLSRAACTEKAERSARRRALRLTLKVCERGLGPNATPPPRRWGTLERAGAGAAGALLLPGLRRRHRDLATAEARGRAAAARREVRARGLVDEALVEVLAEDGLRQVGLRLLAERRRLAGPR